MSGLRQKVGTLRSHVARHGPLAGLRLLAGEPLERSGVLRVSVCHALPDALRTLRGLAGQPGVMVRMLSVDEVRERAARGEDWFFPGAVEASIARGDVCFGGFMGDVLACSGWYATRPVPALGAVVGFAEDCVWEHRLFTKPAFRGKGLNALLKSPAAGFFARQGYRTLLNTVIWTNDSSRRLHQRLGYRQIGSLIRVGSDHFGWTLLRGGREYGLRLLD